MSWISATSRICILLGILLAVGSLESGAAGIRPGPAGTSTTWRISEHESQAHAARVAASGPGTGGGQTCALGRAPGASRACAPVARGEDLWDIVIHPNGQRAYVANRSTDNLLVIDLATNRIIEFIDLFPEATHPLGPGPVHLAITPDGSRLLVANAHDGSVTVMDTAGNTVLKTVPVGQMAAGMAVSPDGSLAYVPSGPDLSVSVLDVAKLAVVTTIDVSGGGWPFASAFAPDGSRAYVALIGGPVQVIDPATHTVVDSIAVPDAGWQGDLVISPNGKSGYLASLAGNKILVLDLVNGRVSGTFDVANPEGLALSADGSRLYVGTFGLDGQSDHHLWVFDTQTGKALAGLTFQHPGQPRLVGSDIQGLALTPDGSTLYVPSIDGECVFVVDAAKLEQLGIILANPIPTFSPFRGVLSPDGTHLYVASWTRMPTTVSVLDTKSRRVVGEILAEPNLPCGAESWGLDISPDGRTLYVLSSNDRCVLVADTQSQRFVSSYRIPANGNASHLTSIATHPTGNKAYVLEYNGKVHVLDLDSLNVSATLDTLDNCSVLKLSPDGKRGYAICASGFAVLDSTTDTLLKTIQIGTGGTHFESLFYLGIKPDSSQYLVGAFFKMYLYDAASDNQIRNVDLDQVDLTWLTLGQDFAFSPDGGLGYLAMPDENAVTVFDTNTWQATAKIDTGRAPHFGTEPVWLLMSSDGGTLYVLNELSDNVLVIDTTTNKVTGVISLYKCRVCLPLILRGFPSPAQR